jgi:hypothetical protein
MLMAGTVQGIRSAVHCRALEATHHQSAGMRTLALPMPIPPKARPYTRFAREKKKEGAKSSTLLVAMEV